MFRGHVFDSIPDNGGILEGFDVPHAIDRVWIFDGVAGSDDRDELVAFRQSSIWMAQID